MQKLFNKGQSLFQTTEITEAQSSKSSACTIATFKLAWFQKCEIIFKDTYGIHFTAFFSEL